MIAEGHKTVAEGWRMFEEAVDESMPRDLPQLLRQLKEKTMLTPPPSPMDIGQAIGQTQPVPPMPSPVKMEGGSKSEEPVIVIILGHRNWACPQCNTVRAHIMGVMPTSDRFTQEKPWCVRFAAFPLTIWIC